MARGYWLLATGCFCSYGGMLYFFLYHTQAFGSSYYQRLRRQVAPEKVHGRLQSELELSGVVGALMTSASFSSFRAPPAVDARWPRLPQLVGCCMGLGMSLNFLGVIVALHLHLKLNEYEAGHRGPVAFARGFLGKLWVDVHHFSSIFHGFLTISHGFSVNFEGSGRTAVPSWRRRRLRCRCTGACSSRAAWRSATARPRRCVEWRHRPKIHEIHGKSMENPWKIHGNRGEIEGFPPLGGPRRGEARCYWAWRSTNGPRRS